jgi:hypothetical protein
LTPSSSRGVHLSPFRSSFCLLLLNKRVVNYSCCLACKLAAYVLIIGWHISKHLMHTFLFIFHRLGEMRGELKTYSWAEPTRIPTFFPPGDSDPYQEYGYHIGVAIISMLFGLIHCLGWSLVFLSGTERFIWRLSAVIISALPVLVLCSYSIHLFAAFILKLLRAGNIIERTPFDSHSLRLNLFVDWVAMPAQRFRMAIWWIFVVLVPIYLLARTALLVEAFFSLRSLPPGAYSVVTWTEYIPHI